MKKYIYILLTGLVLGSCQKDLKDKFYDPDKLSEGVADIVPGLFTQVLTHNRVFQEDYGEWWYMLQEGVIVPGYIQVAQRYVSDRYGWYSTYDDLKNGTGFDDAPLSGEFTETYTIFKNWEIVKREVEKRSGQDQLNAQIYFRLLTLMKVARAAKSVDLFNSIPYFDAYQGLEGVYYPKYDDPQKIYESVIMQLDSVIDVLPGDYAQMDPKAQGILGAQDLAYHGDITKWVEFANALRLRLLVRIAGVDEAFAKPLIADALAKPLPDEDLIWQFPYALDVVNGGTWQRGVRENPYGSFIPNIIMKRMNYGDSAYNEGEDDPRLPVLAMPTKYRDYRGVSYNIDEQTALYNSGDRYYPYDDDLDASMDQNAKSMYSITTFMRNAYMPVYMFSLAELDLIKAEIALKGLGNTGKSAGDHIKDAVIHSTDFWYHINQLSQYWRDRTDYAQYLYPAKPSPAVVAAWGDKVKANFEAQGSVDDKMEILMQQKYIHLNLIGLWELWAEFRRTRHPKLEPMTWQGKVMKPVPERIHYPGSELSNNTDNYSQVAQEDNLTSPIFWVPPAQRSETPYWNDYNYH